LVRTYIVHMLLLACSLVMLRQVVLVWLALRDLRTKPRRERLSTAPRVSVLVPAYNEENVIADALASLMTLDYPDYEIIVIDDGSSDATLERAREVAASRIHPVIRVVTQPNNGKASALNTAIQHASGEFFLCVDADSRLSPDAIRRGLPHFTDPRVGAVGGYIEVANADSLLTSFQQLEYQLSLNFLRRALSRLAVVPIVPGPLGLFRREAMLDAGGYLEGRDLYAEDADLTVRMLSRGWRVRGESRMIAYTEAPEILFALLRQRYRWRRGIFQALQNNIYPLMVDGGLREVAIGLFLVGEAFLLEVLNFGITLFFLTYFFRFGELGLILAWYIPLFCLEVTAFLIAMRGRPRIGRWFGVLVLQRLSYAFLLQAWGVLSLFDEWLETRMSWDKLERLGRLSA
jgi:cellulose synthase/poly-beta-1,6-N-acetylglucosamine synthase-like glycosyltransferase